MPLPPLAVRPQDTLGTPSRSADLCAHCGNTIPLAETGRFCCAGCETVYAFLERLGMREEFYSLKAGKKSPLKPLLVSDEDFSALDAPPFRNPSENAPSLDFFIEGIHCTACIWLLERLPDMTDDAHSARLDFGRSLLRVILAPNGRFETIARILYGLGYRPHPVLNRTEADEKLAEEDRKTLRRMGISAFAAMNVMIYSVSLYTGVDGGHGTLFRWLSIATALPALTYGAWPFYKNAWTALRSKRISIDLPISLAFIGGFAESLRQTLEGSNLLYLDSLTSLVFLMLGSRYALSRLERAEVSKSGMLQSLLPSRCILLVRSANGEWSERETHSKRLRLGDRIALKTGTTLPADATLVEGEIHVDAAFLTGESEPVRLATGMTAYAGCRVLEGNAHATVSALGEETRLGGIQAKLEALPPKRNRRTERSDRWAVLFLASVLGFTALLLALYGRTDLDEAMRRSLSLLIIACPCALALATPLTLSRTHRLASSLGILVRDPDVFERLASVESVVFDKTGTLTDGSPRVASIEWSKDAQSPSERNTLESVLYSLEKNSRHPYGQAIARALENAPGVQALTVDGVKEITGFGVEGLYEGALYRIGKSSTTGAEFTRNGTPIARIRFESPVRKEAKAVIAGLKRRGLKIRILSGDHPAAVESAAHALGIEVIDTWEGNLSPEMKRDRIEALGERALMVGDGANDALVLRSAWIGAAMSRGNGVSIDATLSSSEVALLGRESGDDLESALDLFRVGDRYRSTLLRNALLSAGYNLVGASLAVSGIVHPLVAAVAMPVSALTVYFSTYFGLRRLPPRQSVNGGPQQ